MNSRCKIHDQIRITEQNQLQYHIQQQSTSILAHGEVYRPSSEMNNRLTKNNNNKIIIK